MSSWSQALPNQPVPRYFLSGRRSVFYVVCLLAILAAVGSSWLQLRYAAREALPIIKAVPDFQLTERSGQLVSLEDLKGKVLLVDFVYSECPGPCPMISSRFSSLQEEVKKVPDALMLTITLNPGKDTPKVLQAYADRFHASPDRWLFLTGDKAKVMDLVVNGFMTTVLESNDLNQPLVHSTKIALVDKKGMIRGYFDAINGSESETKEADGVLLKALKQVAHE